MAVQTECHGDAGVAEHLTHELGINAMREQERRGGMPLIMTTDARQTSSLQQRVEPAVLKD